MQKEFIEKLTELMDTEEVLNMKTVLKTIEEWDSLSQVAFLAIAQNDFGISVKPADVKSAQTVQDLYNLVAK